MKTLENQVSETITLQVPGQIYSRVKQAAGQDQQAVEQLLVNTLLSGFSLLDDLPDEMVLDMAALALLNDRALWQLARQTMPDEDYQRMDQLLAQKNQGTLNELDQKELERYLANYQKIVLQRSQSAVLLQQRGYDLSNPQVLANSTPIPA